ncbi:MAG: tyrosine-type recombinase/integrase [Hyphomonadaceae bacterium]
MSIYRPKHSKLYHYDFQIKGERFHGTTGTPNKRAAEEHERRLRAVFAKHGAAALRQTSGTPASELTLDVAVARWWEDVGERLDTAKDRERQLLLWIDLLGKDKRLSTIREADIATAIRKRRAMLRRGKPPSDATINRFIAALRAVWRHLDSDEHPLPRIKWGKWTTQETIEHPPEISGRQMEKLFQAAQARAKPQRKQRKTSKPADWLELMVLCFSTYGMRGGEIYFPPSALDVEEATIFIPKKRRKREESLTVTLLAEHVPLLAARKSRAEAAGLPHLWYDETGKGLVPVTRYRGDYQLREALKAAGLGTKIHRLRHHVGTELLRASGGNLKLVKEQLGHASIQSTQRYARVSEEDRRQAIAKMARRSRKAGGSN